MTDKDVRSHQHLRARATASDRARQGHVDGQQRTRHESSGFSPTRTPSNIATKASPSLDPYQTDYLDDRRTESNARHSHHGKDDRKMEPTSHRSHRHKSSGAFLLSNAAFDPTPSHDSREDRPSERAGKSSISEVISSSGKGKSRETISPEPGSDVTSSHAAPTPAVPSRSSAPASDVESTQIVNMALNLSESRRLASRRASAQPAPPRLTPLPDSTAPTGSLRQHLQQQRRVSRTISPKPDKGSFGKPGANRRVSSPLQAAFDPVQESSYRFHFSPSTLARTQKAKDYLELQAQHRRLLEFVPPLKPSRPARTWDVNSPATSSTDGLHITMSDPGESLGRPYNPLQYIRNRKVRARERRGIDGDARGFGDVAAVTAWVDDVAKHIATRQIGSFGGSTTPLPPFAPGEDGAQTSSPSGPTRPGTSSAKPKRPRVDWFVDPSDMLADVDWLEQDDNKRLVEDRNWHRVFPQDAQLYRPVTRTVAEKGAATPPEPPPVTVPTKAPDATTMSPEATTSTATTPPKVEHDHLLSGARSRARQKLQDMRILHHRHTSSTHSQDFLRLHPGSMSESSDTDSDPRLRARTGTITSSGRNILEKQMMEMLAKESREDEVAGRPENGPSRLSNVVAPTAAPPAAMVNRTKPTVADAKAPGDSPVASPPAPELPSQPGSGRASLEVPPFRREMSFEYESSMPNSPELRPSRRDAGMVPAIGMDLSPGPSRTASPAPRPMAKVRNIFKDRTREQSVDSPTSDRNEAREKTASPSRSRIGSLELGREGQRHPDRSAVASPARESTVSVDASGRHKLHRSHGSTRSRRDENAGGLRSLFKGPRIDSVLRSSVSKVSDMIWRKGSAESADVRSSGASSDESESDQKRGRARATSEAPSHSSSDLPANDIDTVDHAARSYLGVLPSFKHSDPHHSKSPGSSRGSSRRPSRFDLLKPPKIDVQNASPKSSPPAALRPSQGRDDLSDADSRKSSYADAVREADARLNAILALPPPLTARSSRFSVNEIKGRELSISGSLASADLSNMPSKRDIARQRALLLSSGILAKEIARRATEPHRRDEEGSDSTDGNQTTAPLLFGVKSGSSGGDDASAASCALTWRDITRFVPPTSQQQQDELSTRPLSQAELYPLAARILGTSIQTAGQDWNSAADAFTRDAAPRLQQHIDGLRRRLLAASGPDLGLSALTRAAADEADDVSRDLAAGQRLQVKRVVDGIEKLLRRRRRRFRWVRRGGWLAVEWVLVGFMWYVWFVVMIARVALGIGTGLVRGVRWLLWL